MIIIHQEKILFTYFDFHSFTSTTNVKLIKFLGNVHFVDVKRCMLV